MTAQQIAEESAQPELRQSAPGGLHQPWRGLVALAELLVAAVALWVAFWFWSRSSYPVTTVLEDGTRFESSRMVSHWVTAAIGVGMLAVLLVLDALRQAALAVRIRPSRRREADGHTANSQV